MSAVVNVLLITDSFNESELSPQTGYKAVEGAAATGSGIASGDLFEIVK